MKRFWQQLWKSEKGQALPIVLSLMFLGGLLITPSLDYMSTSLNASRIIKENVKGVYAADAGVEYALWNLKHALPVPAQLPATIDQMQVTINTVNHGTYILAYYQELIGVSGNHYDYLSVTGDIVWDDGEQAYKYTITVTRLPAADGNIKLSEVGVRLPVGYDYQTDSAALFGTNLSASNPAITEDPVGAKMLSWSFSPPLPTLSASNPTRTQQFYFTGTGDLVGDYTWVRGEREDVGVVGEFTGTLYTITATATNIYDSQVNAKIETQVIVDETTYETRTILWKVTPQ